MKMKHRSLQPVTNNMLNYNLNEEQMAELKDWLNAKGIVIQYEVNEVEEREEKHISTGGFLLAVGFIILLGIIL